VSPRPAGIASSLVSSFALAGARARVLFFAAAAAGLALAALIWPLSARADTPSPSLDGPWNMSAIAETFTVQQWSSACGPAPVTGTIQPSTVVRVRTQGPELEIDGGRRTLRTDGCLDGMPTLATEAHSSDGRSWRTRCSTPPSDPRRATINTAYFLTGDDAIQVAETGRYEMTINGAHCIADVKRDASLKKVTDVPGASASGSMPYPFATSLDTPGPSPAPTVSASARGPVLPGQPGPVPSSNAPVTPPTRGESGSTAGSRPDCSLPGAATRLEVRPSRKLLRVGEGFGFRAVVLDANGCATGTSIQWTVGGLRFKDGQSHPQAPVVEGGKLSVPADLPDSTFDVVATAAGHSARASVEVASPATFEALLAQSGLGPTGEREEPAVAILATGSIGASDVQAEDGSRQRRTLFMAIVGVLAVGLAGLGAIGVMRARKARAVEKAAESRHADRMREYERYKLQREEAHAAQMNAHLASVATAQRAAEAAAARGTDSGPMFCPSCRKEFQGGGAYCPFDSNRLVAMAGHQDLMAGPSGGICPTCRRGFNPGVKVCPHDGEELVPAGMVAVATAPVPVRGKICPTCGGRFDGTATFCGKDGTQLVLLN
jgi:hypothetical protein